MNHYYFGLGADSTSDAGNVISDLKERGPAIGVNDNKFIIYQLAGGPTINNVTSVSANSGDWLRVKLEIDPNYVFTDDGSLGAGHLYYYNLTAAGTGNTGANTGFQRLTSTPVKLHLEQMYSDVQDPSTWNTMALAKNGDIGDVQVDNLVPHVSPYVYNFEHVKNGALWNNDGWQKYNNLGSSLEVRARDASNLSTYPTKLVDLDVTGTQVVIRPNDERFSFPAHGASDTSALMQFDFKYVPNEEDYAYYFGLGADEDDSGAVNDVNERGPAFGVLNNQFVIRELADGGDGHNDVFTEAIDSEAEANDWIRLRHVIDFTANAGDGAGRLFYQNLTRGDTGFLELTTSPVNLSITDMPSAIRDPSTWDTMVLVKSGAATGAQITNIIANVPEPASLLLVLVGVLGLGLMRRRPRR